MTRTKRKQEPDLIDQMLDQIDFKGLSQEEVLGQDGILKRLTGRGVHIYAGTFTKTSTSTIYGNDAAFVYFFSFFLSI
jgi:hypothetical protein